MSNPMSKTTTIEGLVVKADPLPPMTALDLIPEMTMLLDSVDGISTDVGFFISLARALAGGKLRSLLPQVCAGTKVSRDGIPQPVTLNSVDAFNVVFDGYMAGLVGVVAFALEVTYRDFFEGGARAVKKYKGPSPLSGSNPNTKNTG